MAPVANSTSSPTNNTTSVPGPYEKKLYEVCHSKGIRLPSFQDISDRRGGRTAWSSMVVIQGVEIQARFFYDGQYAGKAREDAAQLALERLGAIPRSGVDLVQQLQQAQGGQNGQAANQQRSYGSAQR